MLIDLHMHSNSSDGQYSPSELIELSERKQLQIVALTDHDTVDGICEAKERARTSSVKFIPGIEISSREYEEVHIVGLGIDENNQYTNIKDMSCILVYDNSISGFKALENAFPTIYLTLFKSLISVKEVQS